ncbi:hypothetical protein EIN_092020 [Entamoeba invadens IP1]|uniref:Uncharacterized protein n=1 Tax=Entamoeba invadens IP1 TaxID=370355 RepID=A0A0A1U1X6_ENTIV|nr:hypothetical protein EIN_092020 [Entamoeba invadens IP1]ELP86637.1 hypothetical protein EIN_092020 [Entamoeba invadens IP1]|eukprot:XP_004185983.1 hypothetical protein EIN_092020 [Entamoeba invadens IP1]
MSDISYEQKKARNAVKARDSKRGKDVTRALLIVLYNSYIAPVTCFVSKRPASKKVTKDLEVERIEDNNWDAIAKAADDATNISTKKRVKKESRNNYLAQFMKGRLEECGFVFYSKKTKKAKMKVPLATVLQCKYNDILYTTDLVYFIGKKYIEYAKTQIELKMSVVRFPVVKNFLEIERSLYENTRSQETEPTHFSLVLQTNTPTCDNNNDNCCAHPFNFCTAENSPSVEENGFIQHSGL